MRNGLDYGMPGVASNGEGFLLFGFYQFYFKRITVSYELVAGAIASSKGKFELGRI